MTTRNNAQEEAGWGELNEMLQEVYEIQEMEGETSGPTTSNRRRGARRLRFQTPVVIIRISLAPARTPIFTSPQVITDAQTSRPVVTPTSAKPYVPIQAPQGVAPDGIQPRGVVFMPQRNTNQVYVATNSPTYAGSWIRRQSQTQPAFGRRIRKVQVLVDGKPCTSCVNQLVKSARPAMPQGTRMAVRHVQNPGTSTNAVPYRATNRPVNPNLIRPMGYQQTRPPAGLRSGNTTGQIQRPIAPATTTRRPQAPVAQVRRPMPPSTGPVTLAPRRPNGQFAPRQQPTTGMRPVAPTQQRPAQQQPTGQRPVAPVQQRPQLQRPAPQPQGLIRRAPVAGPMRSTVPQRETQSFLGALFGESGL